MKIDFLKNNFTNFGSTPLYKARIQKHWHECEETSPCDVYITKLDKYDLIALKRDEADWEDTSYAKSIIEALDSYTPEEEELTGTKTAFFAVETPNSYGERQIRALAMATNTLKDNQVELNWITANNGPNMPYVIKGAGACLLYAVLKFAKKCNADSFYVYSNDSALKFYKRYGLNREEAEYNEFTLPKRLLKRKTDLMQKKYSIEPAGFVG